MKSDPTIDTELHKECERLRAENTRMKALLVRHGIPWEPVPPQSVLHETPASYPTTQHSHQSHIAAKVALFRRLFRGREDVYALRWESSKGTSGYSPACGNEWKPGVCAKPRVKCGDCDQRVLLPLTDHVIHDHLAGKHTVGVYPLFPDDACFFLAVDFDGADWREDARALMRSCRELEVPAALEISRSGQGAHLWLFFAEAVPARDARRLGAALISHTCSSTRQLALSSYDRLFPNQDTLPKGGFGNLVALPLQKRPSEKGRSVFVDEGFNPYPDQWAFLASIVPMSAAALDAAIPRATGGGHPLDVAFVTEEDEREPWKAPLPSSWRIPGPLPESLRLVLANQIFVEKTGLPQPLANRLIRLAAFQNPEFYKAQAMRLPVWNKPRVIGCAENFPHHIGLPRGCLAAVTELLTRHNIFPDVRDERQAGKKITVGFKGVLRSDQTAAVEAMLTHETGVLCAPTAYGKTIVAAAIVAGRQVTTLILVHRVELLRQWQERLSAFLDLPTDDLGFIGGGKHKPSGRIDIAVMQTLSRQQNLAELLNDYGLIIIDECHHVPAFSFESILKQARARYVVGLTATPVRRDGHHPIIFMQCGPIRHSAQRSETVSPHLEVWPRLLDAPALPADCAIQEVFRTLLTDASRNQRICRDILDSYREGRKIIVLTERTEHLDLLRKALGDTVERCYMLHGRMSKKERAAVVSELSALDESSPRVLLATGRLIGEGFDYPPLDTLVLAMPISWKGTLQQYAGRLHREHAGKADVRIYDYVEQDHPQLARMWRNRLRGYRAMGYSVRSG